MQSYAVVASFPTTTIPIPARLSPHANRPEPFSSNMMRQVNHHLLCLLLNPMPGWFCLALSTPPFLTLRCDFPLKRRKRQVESLFGYHRLDDEEEEKDILDQAEGQGPEKWRLVEVVAERLLRARAFDVADGTGKLRALSVHVFS
jgi:hypothetical protein